MNELRWFEKVDGTKTLQQSVMTSPTTGKWEDIPTEKENPPIKKFKFTGVLDKGKRVGYSPSVRCLEYQVQFKGEIKLFYSRYVSFVASTIEDVLSSFNPNEFESFTITYE